MNLTYEKLSEMFCKLDVRRKLIVTLELSSDSRKIVVRYFVNRAPGFLRGRFLPLILHCQWRNDGVAAASSDGGPTGGRGPPTVLEF